MGDLSRQQDHGGRGQNGAGLAGDGAGIENTGQKTGIGEHRSKNVDRRTWIGKEESYDRKGDRPDQ
ncbi:MAG: hypothetical protein HFI65_07390 [Lachnospiraceae bacterium]|nr:hypothetical protein [Lachnospiraceae bacterium]